MAKKIIIFLLCFIAVGCTEKEIKTTIENDDNLVSINYPVTNISALDDAVSAYVNKTYNNFKNNYQDIKKPELNISYTYKELNDSVINISLNTEINAGKKINKIKTFTYDKNTEKFLTMEDLVQDLDVLDYDIKKELLEKYQEADMDFLTNVSYDYFTIDDENLTIYFNPTELKSTNKEMIYLDIPLNSLKLLIDIDKSKGSDTYFNLKKRNISDEDKIVALTFDDGPSKYTDSILDTLKKYDACATFFVIGNKVDFYDETLNKMLKNGNEIGNHSYSHKWLNRLSEQEFKNELNKTQEEVKKATGYTPKLFRPTYGGYSDRLKKYTDLTFVLWDVDSSDWKVKNTDKIIKNVIPNVKDGSIVLMHDNHKYAADAIEAVVKKLKEEGYEFVTVSELLELKELRES
ncbi:MAG: polysaccharide deacetylase family protein [Oscillospiraceae bacterium]